MAEPNLDNSGPPTEANNPPPATVTPKAFFFKHFLRTSRRRNLPPLLIPENIGHRVWIGDIPRGTSVRQLLSAIRGIGGVVEVAKADINAPMTNGQTFGVSLATVVFANRDSARSFMRFTQDYGVLLKPERAHVRPEDDIFFVRDRELRRPNFAYAYPIAKPTAPYVNDKLYSAEMGWTRVWELTAVPVTAVWFVLSSMGLQEILHASYNKDSEVLTVEFFTVRAAVAAKDRIVEDGCPYLANNPIHTQDEEALNSGDLQHTISFRPDQCDDEVESLLFEPGITPWVSDVEFEKYNELPYNIHWPIDYHPCMDYAHLEVRTNAQQWSLLKSCDYLSRHSWSWDVPLEAQESVECLKSTIGTHEWARAWHRWFNEEAWRSDNLIKVYDYGEAVHHRQEMAGTCDGHCDYGCNIKNSPVPQVVQDFLSGQFEATGVTDHDSESSHSQDDTEFTTDSDHPSTSVDASTPLTPVDKFLAYVNMKASWGLFGHPDPKESDSQDEDFSDEDDDSDSGPPDYTDVSNETDSQDEDTSDDTKDYPHGPGWLWRSSVSNVEDGDSEFQDDTDDHSGVPSSLWRYSDSSDGNGYSDLLDDTDDRL